VTKRFCLPLLGFLTVCFIVGTADALSPFKGAFDKKYVAESKNDDFKAAFKTRSCNVCHVKGEKKTVRNAYGHELHEALEKGGASPKKLVKEDKEKLLKLLDEAFVSVAKKKTKDGVTYEELFEKGALPPEAIYKKEK